MNNPFTILQLNPTYDIDEEGLEHQYQDMMHHMHPDKYNTKAEQDIAIIRSVEINQAYAILKDPIKRAASLLALKYVDTDQLQMSLERLSHCLEIQENNDIAAAQNMFNMAQENFGKAWNASNLDSLKENFLVMKYLERFLRNNS